MDLNGQIDMKSLEKSLKKKFCIIYDSALRKFRSQDFITVSSMHKQKPEENISEGARNDCENSIDDSLICTVQCLQSLEELKELCEKSDLIFCDGPKSEEVYEVDLILEDKEEEGERLYHVKWKNYSLTQNTWEPYEHLDEGCEQLLGYYQYLNHPLPRKKVKFSMLSYFISDLTTRKPYDVLSMCRLCSMVLGALPSYYMSLSLTNLKEHVKSVLKLPLSKLEHHAEKIFALMKFSEKRKHTLIALEEWKQEINADNPASYIEVENNVDLETIPEEFQFIHDYVSKDIIIPEEPVVFCQCDDCHVEKNSCCAMESDACFAYNRYGRLQLLPGYPIYECNKLCKCGPDCTNRVVQHGQKVKVSIFKTTNGCGWGLKTLETIQKDQFVLEYLGEILTSEDAEIRGSLYDDIGRSYLFDLDYGEANCLYTVDAGCAGNAAHFINHSCDPNLHVFAVWIDNQSPHLPRLAFFAKKKILRGEELTFDYKMVKHTENGKINRVPCKCNSRNCRKFLY